MEHLLNLSRDALADWFAERDEPRFRADQVRRWLFQRRATDFGQMSDLGKRDREALTAQFRLWSANKVAEHRAEDGTEKVLLGLGDRQRIECVLIRDNPRRTICISTQVGCAMGCVFCASGLDGVERNLTKGEIVEQMLRLAQHLPSEERVTHIVVMGMGEPLANLRGLLPALAEATSSDGLGISARRITISTVGLPAGIRQLAAEDHPYHLAISLHAPNDALRNELVPVNRQIGIAAIMEAAEDYFQATGRRLTFEYVLLADINDRSEHAEQLVRLFSQHFIGRRTAGKIPTAPRRSNRCGLRPVATIVRNRTRSTGNLESRRRDMVRRSLVVGLKCGRLKTSKTERPTRG
jgi:23S rRNA (adenine2503-C2)-methyltransferase